MASSLCKEHVQLICVLFINCDNTNETENNILI